MTTNHDLHGRFHKQALIFVTHKLNIDQLNKYKRLKLAFSSYGDVFLVRQLEEQSCQLIDGIDEVVFTIEDLDQLPYKAIESSIIPGSNHFILFLFFKKYPYYSHYWNIEYDVEYSGEWKDLFDNFAVSESDFLSSHIRPFNKEPEWYWWSSLFTGKIHIPLRERIASFNPIYRMTARAMIFLHNTLSSGWTGHHEVFIPTVLKLYGFNLEDFGGNGEYVIDKNRNKFYTEDMPFPFGTMRHCPSFSVDSIDKERKLLYHPVK